MALPVIRITDLVDAGLQDPKDKIQLQRQVLGVWTDYHTTLEVLDGPVQTIVYDWPSGTDFGEFLVCPSGKLLLVVNAFAVFTPGNSPTNLEMNIGLLQGSSLGYLWMSWFDTSQGVGVSTFPLNDPTIDPYVDLDQDILISGSSTPGGYSGSTRIIIQYLLIDAV